MIETSGHLPECAAGTTGSGLDCICPALRACEQRSYTLGIEVGKHDGWVAGHAAGVQAARDAVAGLASRLSMTKREGGYDCCGCSSPDDLHDDALAAIDALRGDA